MPPRPPEGSDRFLPPVPPDPPPENPLTDPRIREILDRTAHGSGPLRYILVAALYELQQGLTNRPDEIERLYGTHLRDCIEGIIPTTTRGRRR